MTLNKEMASAIEHYIKEHIQEWISPFTGTRGVSEREMEIRERIVRVEESLERQQALMRQGFEQVDKRFEQVDKRFESLSVDMKIQFNRVYGFLAGVFIFVVGGFVTMMIQMLR